MYKRQFQNIGKRFTFGGEAPMDQRIYYFNTKELVGNKMCIRDRRRSPASCD